MDFKGRKQDLVDSLNVVVMSCEGLYQRYLIKRIHEEFELAGVVLCAASNPKGTLLSRLARYHNPIEASRHLQARILMLRYQTAAKPLVERLFYEDGHAPCIPADVPTISVENINNEKAVNFVSTLRPDIVCVNGTNLLRKPMLDLIPLIRHGIVNMHTGLSPYSRGGNCNLFMLLEGHPELVGVTIHHIDRGIDSGDIIISARPELESDDNYETIDAKTFKLGIDLMLVAVRQLVEGRAQRIKQWEKGKLFLKRTGYVYKPYLRVVVNRKIKRGTIRHYIENKESMDGRVSLIGEHK